MKNQESTQDRIIRVTEELTAKVSANNTSSGKWRGSYTLYKQPNARQQRENKNKLGSPIGPTVKSLTYDTEEEALASVEETAVSKAKLKQQIVAFYDQNYPEHDVTVKLFLLRHWDKIVAQSSCSENVLKMFFFDHETFVEILCNFQIKGRNADDFHCLVQDLMSDGFGDDEIIRMMRYMKYIFRVAKDAGVYTRNPVTEVLREYTGDQMLMKDLRKALVLKSLSREENIRMIGILRKHKETEPGMVIGFMVRWLTAMFSREVAPLIWKDLVVVERVNIMQILVYKEFSSKDTTVREMTYDDLYRVVPACLLLREALEEYRDKLREKLANVSDEEFELLPVVAFAAKPTEHITPDALTKFCNVIREELAIEQRLIKVMNSRGEQRVIDLSRAQGD